MAWYWCDATSFSCNTLAVIVEQTRINMRNKLIFAYIFFLAVEYFLRTFVEQFKYHRFVFLIEFLPIMTATLITSFFSRKVTVNKYFHEVYLKFSFVSILGFLTAKTILFYQWYWILHPEYKNDKLDMYEGLAWTIIFSFVGIIYILISYLILYFITERNYNKT